MIHQGPQQHRKNIWNRVRVTNLIHSVHFWISSGKMIINLPTQCGSFVQVLTWRMNKERKSKWESLKRERNSSHAKNTLFSWTKTFWTVSTTKEKRTKIRFCSTVHEWEWGVRPSKFHLHWSYIRHSVQQTWKWKFEHQIRSKPSKISGFRPRISLSFIFLKR